MKNYESDYMYIYELKNVRGRSFIYLLN